MNSIILTTYLLFNLFCALDNIFGNDAFSMALEKLKNLALPERVAPESGTVKLRFRSKELELAQLIACKLLKFLKLFFQHIGY